MTVSPYGSNCTLAPSAGAYGPILESALGHLTTLSRPTAGAASAHTEA